MNSFNYIARGIDAEVARQIEIWEAGGEVQQETFDFDAGSGTLTPRRSKEEADDYRYFPSPISYRSSRRPRWWSGCAPRFPSRRRTAICRLAAELDLERALVLVTGGLDALYEATVAAGADRIAAANVIANNLVGAGVDPAHVDAGELAQLVEARERIPRQVARRGDLEGGRPRLRGGAYLGPGGGLAMHRSSIR